MSHWIILDRDGVINQDSENYIRKPEEWIPIEGSLEAIALLNQKGYYVAVATNQSGIARRYYPLEVLDKIHQKMHTLVKAAGGEIKSVAFCPHGPDDSCSCRKPKPGMLLKLARDFAIDLSNTFYVGDSYRDIEAARAANAKPALVKTGNGEKALEKYSEALKTCPVFDSLLTFAQDVPAYRPYDFRSSTLERPKKKLKM